MVSVVAKFHLNVDSIRSLAHYSDFLFLLADSRSDSSNCHEGGGKCTDTDHHTHAHIVCVSKTHFITSHVIVECSFDLDTTHCFTDATDWNQIAPSARGWTVWSSGRFDPTQTQRFHFDGPQQFGSHIDSCASQIMKILDTKASVDKGMGKNSKQSQHGKEKNQDQRRKLFSKHKESQVESPLMQIE